MEQNFIIHSSQCVVHMLDVIQAVDTPLKVILSVIPLHSELIGTILPERNYQAELLSVFTGILRKSKCNLMMTMETNFIEKTLDMLKVADKLVADLLIELLGIVASFSVTVKELKSIFLMLKGSNDCWVSLSVIDGRLASAGSSVAMTMTDYVIGAGCGTQLLYCLCVYGLID